MDEDLVDASQAKTATQKLAGSFSFGFPVGQVGKLAEEPLQALSIGVPWVWR